MINTFGFASGSHVNFTCDPFYERIGKFRVYCTNGEWEKDIPNCQLIKEICMNKPPLQDGLTYIKSLSRVEIKNETDYVNSQKIVLFTIASYVCRPGSTFENKLNLNFKSFNGTMMPYQNVTCIGPNTWESVPKCVLQN